MANPPRKTSRPAAAFFIVKMLTPFASQRVKMRPQQRAATSRRQSQAASAGKMPAARSWKVLDLEPLQAQSTRGSPVQPSGGQRNSAPAGKNCYFNSAL
jgi:hypothetical protein